MNRELSVSRVLKVYLDRFFFLVVVTFMLFVVLQKKSAPKSEKKERKKEHPTIARVGRKSPPAGCVSLGRLRS